MGKNEQIKFSLRKITTEQFAILEDAFDASNQNIQVNNTVKFGCKLEKRLIKVLLSVNFSQEKGPFLLAEIGCFFEISEGGWDECLKKEIQEIHLPLELSRHFVVLATGTLRGVLHAKTENTKFNTFYLPTINVNNMITEEVKIKID